MTKTKKLSVVLATFNEQENIARCLDAVKTIADEIIIVDGSSTDDTRKIAESFGAKVIKTTNKPNFHINKQLAISKATAPWILQLDADEVVTKDLAKEISSVINMSEKQIRTRTIPKNKQKIFNRHLAIVQQRDGDFNQTSDSTDAFFVPRLNMFLGKPLRHGGVYPDAAIRLIRNGNARLPAKDVHELMQVDGRVDWLQHDLLHYDSPTFSKYILRANRYTDLTAANMAKQKLSTSVATTISYLFFKPGVEFLTRYFRHKAVLDGFPGFVFALFSALHQSIAYLKYKQQTYS